MKCLAVVLKVKVGLRRGNSLGSGHLTPAVRWFARCHLVWCQQGELDLMLELKLEISFDKMQLESVEDRDRDCQLI